MRQPGSISESPPRLHPSRAWMTGILVLVLGPAAWAPVHAQDFPIPSFRARYSVSVAGIHAGTDRLSLTRTKDGRYLYAGILKPSAFFAIFFDRTYIQRSYFSFHHGQIKDLRYRLLEKGGHHPTDQSIVFDWSQHVVHMSVGTKKKTLSLPPGTTDEQLAQLRVSYDLLAHGRVHRVYTVAEHDHVRHYAVHIGPRRTFHTPLGKLTATEYYYFNKKGKKIAYWLAPDLYNLIVYMVVHTNAGLRVSMHLHRFTLLHAHTAPHTR